MPARSKTGKQAVHQSFYKKPAQNDSYRIASSLNIYSKQSVPESLVLQLKRLFPAVKIENYFHSQAEEPWRNYLAALALHDPLEIKPRRPIGIKSESSAHETTPGKRINLIYPDLLKKLHTSFSAYSTTPLPPLEFFNYGSISQTIIEHLPRSTSVAENATSNLACFENQINARLKAIKSQLEEEKQRQKWLESSPEAYSVDPLSIQALENEQANLKQIQILFEQNYLLTEDSTKNKPMSSPNKQNGVWVTFKKKAALKKAFNLIR